MTLSPKLELRQSQQLVMTPQLQQAIRLLQLSNLDLAALVDSEVERNPLLERAEFAAERDQETGRSNPPNGTPEPPSSEPEAASAGGEDETFVAAFAAGGQAGWASVRQRHRQFGEGEGEPQANLSPPLSLKDHLEAQLCLAFEDSPERLVGRHLIDLVDEAGYLTDGLLPVAERLGAPLALVDGVLAKLQSFEPAGVFARTLAECLALQLKERNRYDPLIACVLDRLDLVAARDFRALKRLTGADADELHDMIREIKSLDPKPGLKFDTSPIAAVVPDVTLARAQDGSLRVELNGATLPRLLVNRTYAARIARGAKGGTDRAFIVQHLQAANWLVRSLDQRARTILRVAEEIVRQQQGFFAHGVRFLRPLNLKAVADAIGMHESTVSRVTSNKFIATPRGTFELKFFFMSAIPSSAGNDVHASEAVRDRIRQLIEREEAGFVLSDEDLVERLRQDGIGIARRTVAKYREAMHIASSVQRRREKQRPWEDR